MVNRTTPRPTSDERSVRARTYARGDRTRLTGCVLTAAVAAAPFFALLYGLNAALAVMTMALTVTAYLARTTAGRAANPATRQRLGMAVVVNVLLAVGCAIALVVRLM